MIMNHVEIVSLGRRRQENSLTFLKPRPEVDEELVLSQINDFLLESVEFYPGIDSWWRNRVVPGVRTGQRVCHVARVQGHIAAVGIGKRANTSAKLCTLRVRDLYRGLGLGQLLLYQTIKDLVASNCQRVHYTISEDVFYQCGSFFSPYGFSMVSWSRERYAKGIEELVFAADSRRLLRMIPNCGAEEMQSLSRPTYDADTYHIDSVKHDSSIYQYLRSARCSAIERVNSSSLAMLLAARSYRMSCPAKAKVK